MIAISLFAFIVPIMIGFLLIYLSWPDRGPIFKNLLIKLSLAIGAGFGISSLCFFIWVILLGPKDGFIPSIISELSLFFALSIITLWNTKKNTLPQIQNCYVQPDIIKQQPIYKILLISTYVILVMSAASFISMSLKEPHGGWDAWAIWNMHARFLFRGDLDWRNLFSVAIAWTHSDYPLLIPGSIARCWKFIGKETVLVPSIIAMLFTFGTVGVVISSLSMLKGRLEGLLGGLMLMGIPFFIKHGASQYADVPLSFFFCSSLALFSIVDCSYDDRQKLLPLTGLMLAFSAWTKNEGVAFIFSLIAARFLIVTGSKGFKAFVKEAGLLAIGIIPVALILAYFRLNLAPPSDLFRGNVSASLADFSKYFFIIKAFKNQYLYFGSFYIGAMPLLLIYLLMSGIDIKKKNTPLLFTSFITLSFMTGIYFALYLITPYELNWHLATSLDRLFLQLWPSAVIFLFLLGKPIANCKKGDSAYF